MRFLMIGQLVILQSGLVMLIPMEEMEISSRSRWAYGPPANEKRREAFASPALPMNEDGICCERTT